MPLPGVQPPRRFVPRLHWELLACGTRGHLIVGTTARHVRESDALVVRDEDGVRWHRCLRCDSWLPLPVPTQPTEEHPPARDAIELPLRGRPLRDKVVLRLIAINRALHFLVLGLLGAAILLFSASRARLHDTLYRVVADLQGGVSSQGEHHTGLLHELDRVFSLDAAKLHLFAAVAIAYAVVEGVEAVGLWMGKRWAEYLTLLVTASLLPVEVYELTERFSPLKVLTFLLNVAVVVYLLLAKRLFGLRGGAAADEALKARDVGWPALERTAPGAAVE